MLPQLEWAGWSTRFLFFTGKGGVGKTTVAAAGALALADEGRGVLVVSTDPASNLADVFATAVGPEATPVPGAAGLWALNIDPEAAVAAYRERVLAPFREVVDASELSALEEQQAGQPRASGGGERQPYRSMAEVQRYTERKLASAHDLDTDGRALLEEDLRSPGTEEIAVFSAFSRLLGEARDRFVMVDTAPTGHTLLLLDTTGAYHREIMRTASDEFGRMTTPLMRLQDPSYTRVLIVTLADATPVQEAADPQDDLRVQSAEDAGDFAGQVLVHDQPPGPRASVEAVVGKPEQPQVPQRYGTPRPPGDAGHPLRLRRIDPHDRSAKAGLAL